MEKHFKNIDWKDNRNLTMLTDFYEFTMMNGFFNSEFRNTIGYFEI